VDTEILSTRVFKNRGYVLVNEIWHDMPSPHIVMHSSYSWPDLYYIGNSEQAYRLNKKFGITEFYPTHDYSAVKTLSMDEKAKNLLLGKPKLDLKRSPCCLIGFNKQDQIWYGWARAFYRFTIGSQVKKGDIAYNPDNKENFIEDILRFWDFDRDGNCIRKFTDDDNVIDQKLIQLDVNHKENNELGIYIEYEVYVRDDRKKLKFNHFAPYPKKWGHGEWTAKTIEDAKQMAIDFAEGCA